MTAMLPIALWLSGCLFVGYLGRNRRFGFYGCLVASMLLTPPLVLLIVLVTDSADEDGPPRIDAQRP